MKPPALTVSEIALAIQNAERRVAQLHREEFEQFFEEESNRLKHALSVDRVNEEKRLRRAS